MEILEWIAEEHGIPIPPILLTHADLIRLNHLITLQQPILLSGYFSCIKQEIDFTVLNKIKSELNKTKRETLSESDYKLIEHLIKIPRANGFSFLRYFGNIFYISNLIDDFNENQTMTKSLQIALILFAHLQMVEVLSWFIADILRDGILDKHQQSTYNQFMEKFKDGGHPEMGLVINTMTQLGILTRDDVTIFKRSKIIRNRIGHANIFYDSYSDRLMLTNNEEYSFDELKTDFKSLYEFLLEIAFVANNRETDFNLTIKKECEKLRRFFLGVSRSGMMTKAYRGVVLKIVK